MSTGLNWPSVCLHCGPAAVVCLFVYSNNNKFVIFVASNIGSCVFFLFVDANGDNTDKSRIFSDTVHSVKRSIHGDSTPKIAPGRRNVIPQCSFSFRPLNEHCHLQIIKIEEHYRKKIHPDLLKKSRQDDSDSDDYYSADEHEQSIHDLTTINTDFFLEHINGFLLSICSWILIVVFSIRGNPEIV